VHAIRSWTSSVPVAVLMLGRWFGVVLLWCCGSCGWATAEQTVPAQLLPAAPPSWLSSSRRSSERGRGGGRRLSEADADEQLKEESEHEALSESDVAIGWMLLGGILIIAIMFYMVNFPDADIRLYSWSIISTTMSIFMAVLIFQGTKDLVFYALSCIVGFIPEHSELRIAIDGLLFLFWFVAMHLMIVHQSGVSSSSPSDWSRKGWVVADPLHEMCEEEIQCQPETHTGDHGVARWKDETIFVKLKCPEKVQETAKTRCWGMLFAHVAAFADILTMSRLMQHRSLQDPLYALLIVTGNAGLLFLLFAVTRQSRGEDQEEAARQHLGIRFASRHDGQGAERFEMMCDESKEAEDELVCLASSFLLVQALRYSLTGVLPDEEGIEEPTLLATNEEILWLYGVAVLFVTVTAGLVFGSARGRWVDVTMQMAAMGFAWSTMWATDWMALRLAGTHDTLVIRILLALVVSSSGLAAIWVLDKIEDGMYEKWGASGSESLEKRVVKIINMIITCLSVLVGFSWERCFDGGVTAIASVQSHPMRSKLFMSLIAVLVTVQAWRKFILTKVIDLRGRKQERQRARVQYSQPQAYFSGHEQYTQPQAYQTGPPLSW